MNCLICDKSLQVASCECNNKIPECVVEAAKTLHRYGFKNKITYAALIGEALRQDDYFEQKQAALKKQKAKEDAIRKYQNIITHILMTYKGDMSTWPEETQESFREAIFKLNDLMYVF